MHALPDMILQKLHPKMTAFRSDLSKINIDLTAHNASVQQRQRVCLWDLHSHSCLLAASCHSCLMQTEELISSSDPHSETLF